MQAKASIAIVTPVFGLGGGIAVAAEFLYRTLSECPRYRADLFSLATSARDPNSVRLLSPQSWLRGVRSTPEEASGIPYRHVGALFAELEFQRYRPRRCIEALLERYDLVQVVAGSPATALAVTGFRGPVALQVATLAAVERAALLKRERGTRRLWRRWMTTITSRLELSAVRQVDAILVINRWMQTYLQQQTDSSKVLYAPPGVDTDYFRPEKYDPDGPILCVGRLSDPRKNIRLLLEAYARLRRKRAQIPPLCLAGQTGLSERDRAVASDLGITECIELHKEISQEELRKLYQRASLFVLSSDEEGLGLVILEAMASGLPVISTRCGGPETAICEGETGYLTPVGDAAALAARMEELIQDPSRRQQMGQRGRQAVEACFSRQVCGRRFLQTYDALLDRPRAGRS